MKKTWISIGIFFCSLLFVNSHILAQKISHVVVISLDGSRPEFYMDDSWPAPNLQALKSEGLYARNGVESVFPSITWPSHTSIITGKNPGSHGIYYNRHFDGNPGDGYWYYSYIQTPTIFDAVRKAGLTSAAVWWPVTVGAPIDYNFPVRRPEKGEVGDNLTNRYPYIEPRDLLSHVESEIGRKFTKEDMAFKNNAQGNFVATVSKYIIRNYKPNLLMVHFGEIDHAEHGYGTESKEVKEALKFNDSLVGSILSTIKEAGIKDSTVVIITGDHGHTNTVASFAPNIYLAEHGLLDEFCWKAKFFPSGGSAFLYLNKKDDKATLDAVVKILKATPEYKSGYFRILDREQLDRLDANPESPLAIAMKEGINVVDKMKGNAFMEHKKPYKSTHGYDPTYPSMHTSFIAVGPGLTHKNIDGMKLVDIAPFISKLLDLDFENLSSEK